MELLFGGKIKTIRLQVHNGVYLKTIPLGRWGKPEDVGNAVSYFASDEASFITGQTLCVNGGRTPW